MKNDEEAGVICDLYGESTRVDGGDHQFGSLSTSWGAGSQYGSFRICPAARAGSTLHSAVS